MNVLKRILSLCIPSAISAKDEINQDVEVSNYLYWVDGVPQLDGNLVFQQLMTLAPEIRQPAGVALQRSWLRHLNIALGGNYLIAEGEDCLIMSKLPMGTVQSICRYVEKVERILDEKFSELNSPASYGKSILLVLPNSEVYYSYLGNLEEAEGEFPMSSATYISGNCSHFVTHEGELGSIEPIIVHELTHDKLSHLILPTWLQEGVASYMESTFAISRDFDIREASSSLRYWHTADIATFWTGDSFVDGHEGSRASETLALLLVRHLMNIGDHFDGFLRMVHETGEVEVAANDCWGVSLKEMVSALLTQV